MMDECVQIAADYFLGTAVAHQAQEGWIDERATALTIHAVDALCAGIEQHALLLLAIQQRLVLDQDGCRHVVEGASQIGDLVATGGVRRRGLLVQAEAFGDAAQGLDTSQYQTVQQDTPAQERAQQHSHVQQHIPPPVFHHSPDQIPGRQFDTQDPAQFAFPVAIRSWVSLPDIRRGVGRITVAFQAVGFDPDRRRVVIDLLAMRVDVGGQVLVCLGMEAKPVHGREFVAVGKIVGVTWPVGDVVEADAGIRPVMDLPGNARQGMGRQETDRPGIDRHAALHELPVVDPARGHEHGLEIVGIVEQFRLDHALDGAVAGKLDGTDQQHEGDAHAQPDLVLKLHLPIAVARGPCHQGLE